MLVNRAGFFICLVLGSAYRPPNTLQSLERLKLLGSPRSVKSPKTPTTLWRLQARGLFKAISLLSFVKLIKLFTVFTCQSPPQAIRRLRCTKWLESQYPMTCLSFHTLYNIKQVDCNKCSCLAILLQTRLVFGIFLWLQVMNTLNSLRAVVLCYNVIHVALSVELSSVASREPMEGLRLL